MTEWTPAEREARLLARWTDEATMSPAEREALQLELLERWLTKRCAPPPPPPPARFVVWQVRPAGMGELQIDRKWMGETVDEAWAWMRRHRSWAGVRRRFILEQDGQRAHTVTRYKRWIA